MAKPIQIFRAGRHTDMRGRVYEFSAADVLATAKAYDPTRHEAPLVVGHPRHDQPAYGWVASLEVDADGLLLAIPAQVDSAFSEMVQAGRFKRISASLYPPAAPANPSPGVWALRHVGFLGAQPPAIRGLKPAEFAADDDGAITLEFGEADEWAGARLWKGMREFLIEKFGREDADRVTPDYLIEAATPATSEGVGYAAPDDGVGQAEATPVAEEDTMDPKDLTDRQAALEQRELDLAAREEALKVHEVAASRRQVADWAEAQVAAGRVLPLERDGLVELAASLDDGAQSFSFGEGEGAEAESVSARAFLARLIEAMPSRVDFAERADGAAGARGHVTPRALPAGYHADPAEQALANDARAYAEQHQVSFIQAVQALSSK